MINNNCFRNTAICPGDAQQLQETYKLDNFDPYKLGLGKDDIFDKENTDNFIRIGEPDYHRVYTDGSALHATTRELARA